MDIIIDNKVKLIEWLCGEESIFQHVQSRKLVTTAEYLKIKSIQIPSDKITELLDTILLKGESYSIAFLQLLKDDKVNEPRPELKEWIETVNISAVKNKTESSNTPQARPVKISDYDDFFTKNRGKLIDKVKNVDRIVDDLNLTAEMAANVQAERTDQAKMRKILDYRNSRKVSQLLVEALYTHASNVMEDLTSA